MGLTNSAVSVLSMAGGEGLFPAFDEVMRGFMEERSIPGGALCVTYRGSVVLARGYTLLEDPTGPIEASTLFRLASVSKPLCAVAVLRLVQDGRLGLGDSVGEVLGLERLDRRAKILHLLQHQGGWDRSVSFDPHSVDRAIAGELGKELPVCRDDVVEFTLRRPLDFEPGTRYAYSNFGYQLLGHVVERVTGQEYVGFVQRSVLEPLGIVGPRQGFTLPEKRAPGEATYHSSNPNRFGNVVVDGGGNDVPVQYGGYNMENMVTSGGWIASAVDMARFGSAFGGANAVLDGATVERMFAAPTANRSGEDSYYACGWLVKETATGLDVSHTGCLQGVTATLRRRPDGVCFCALFNRREEASPFLWDVDPALGAACDGVVV